MFDEDQAQRAAARERERDRTPRVLDGKSDGNGNIHNRCAPINPPPGAEGYYFANVPAPPKQVGNVDIMELLGGGKDSEDDEDDDAMGMGRDGGDDTVPPSEAEGGGDKSKPAGIAGESNTNNAAATFHGVMRALDDAEFGGEVEVDG